MRMGKHVYGQKPLAQTVYEARYLRNLAQETGVVTQMGNQGSAADGLRRAVECIQAGIIGQVGEVHIWTNRPIWPQGMGRPTGSDPVPDTLNWDIWIGPAPMRPYEQKVYEPFNWRGWLDFGTGALGDMACHTVNMTFRALRLGYPTEIEATPIGGMNNESYPIGSKIRFQFPARKTEVAAAHKTFFHRHDTIEQAPVTLWWYDGGKPTSDPKARGGHDGSNKPPAELTADIVEMLGEMPGSGALLIGDKGTIFSPDDYGEQFFVKLNGEKKYTHFTKSPVVAAIPQVIPRNPFKGDNDLSAASGMDRGHQGEQAGGLLFALCRRRAAHRDHGARLRFVARRPENRVGRAEHARPQLPGGRPVHQTQQPRALGIVIATVANGMDFGPAKLISMKCKTCDGEMIQKSRIRLAMVGIVMLATLALAFVIPHFWVPAIILAFTGAYLLVWATLGRGCWCRNCKKFNLF